MGLSSFFKREKKKDKKEDLQSNIKIDVANCEGCGKCSFACPNNMFVIEDGVSHLRDSGVCRDCKVCVAICPNDCITVN